VEEVLSHGGKEKEDEKSGVISKGLDFLVKIVTSEKMQKKNWGEIRRAPGKRS